MIGGENMTIPIINTAATTLYGNKVIIELKGVSIKALVDSGASVSCIAQSLFQEHSNDQQLESPKVSKVQGVGGNQIRVLGQVSLQFLIGSKSVSHKFLVLDSMVQPIILGLDFLQAQSASIDLGANKLILKDQDGECQVNLVTCKQEDKSVLLKLNCNVTVPPFCEMLVPAMTKPKIHRVMLANPLPSLEWQGLAGARCVCQVNYGQTVFRLLNPSPNSVRLTKGSPIALLSNVSDIMADDAVNEDVLVVEANGFEEVHCVSMDVSDDEYIQKAKELGFDLQSSTCTISPEQARKLMIFLGQNRDVFANDITELGLTHVHSHRIETGDAMPTRQAPYRVNPEKKAEIDKQVEEMLQNDIIEPSTSEWQSPVVLVKKKDGSYRFAVDYRQLNKVTRPFSYPLPRIEDIFDAVGEAKATMFSTLDLASGFWQIPLDPETSHKSAFCTHSGVYAFKRLSFGMMNSPSAFSMVMNEVLRGITFKHAVVYVDDILVYSASLEDHLSHLQEIFTRLREAGLKLKPSKCNFATQKVTYLGHNITKEGIEMEEANLGKVKNYPKPKNVKQVRAFTGLCNYYRRFVKGFADIARPLHNLTKKGASFIWDEKCETAFQRLKKAMISTPVVLAHPKFDKPFILSTDASDYAIGYVLGQLDEKGREQVIAYGGRSLTKDEIKWHTTEKECLAIIQGINYYKVYLNNGNFKVYTDHKALQWLDKNKDESGRLFRWSLQLQPHHCKIEHKAGKDNGPADALSRMAHSNNPEVQSVEFREPLITQFTYLQNHLNLPLVGSIISPDPEQSPVQQIQAITSNVPHNVRQLQLNDPEFSDIVKFLENSKLPKGSRAARRVRQVANSCQMKDGTLYHQYFPSSNIRRKQCIWQLAVPKSLRNDILLAYHDSPAGGGHQGVDKTFAALKAKYYWKSMFADVKIYIQSCEACQQNKRHFHAKPAPLNPLPPVDVFHRWHVDILGPFKKANSFQGAGFQYVLVVVDSFSKWCEAFAMQTMEAVEVAQLLYQNIFCRFGAPHTLVSDRGSNFMSKLVKELCKIFEVTKVATSSYHPQTNSTVERLNSVILQTLRMYIDDKQSNWPDLLSSVMMAYRMAPCTQSTGESPFYILFGRDGRLPIDVALDVNKTLAPTGRAHMSKFLEGVAITREIARQNSIKAQKRNKQQHDKKAANPAFQLAGRVWISNKKKRKGYSPKLDAKYVGPYYISARKNNCLYKLKRSDNHKSVKSWLHADRLKPYFDPTDRTTNCQETNNNPQSELSQTQNSDEQLGPQNNHDNSTQGTDQNKTQGEVLPAVGVMVNVEKLLRRAYKQGKRMYQVKWEGLSTKTWKYEEELPQHLVRLYNIKYNTKGRVKKSFKRQK